MRLFAQISAIIFTLMLFSFGTAALTRYAVVMPQLREIEAQADRKDLRRVLLAIDVRKQQLSTIAYNNAVWDDMYDYLQRRDKPLLDSRFSADKFLTLNIGTIALFDRHGDLVARRTIDPQTGTVVDTPLPLADIRPNLIDLDKVHPHAPIFDSGIMATADGPLLYATASVMRSDANSEARGNLLVAAPIDEEFLREIAEATQLRIARAPLRGDDDDPPALDRLYRDNDNHLSWVLSDNRNRPVLRLILTLPPRDFDTRLTWVPLLTALLVSLVGFAIILLLVQRLLLRPIQAIGQHLQRVQRQGDYNLRLNSNLGNELGDLSRDIDALVKHAQTQQEQLQRQAAEMQQLSYQDGLTGLANRRRFDQALADNWALAQRAQTPLALLMCDVDYFKNFNDHYGHQRGDEVLKQLAEIIRRAVVRHTDLAARYGGEEFSILLPDTNEAGALRIAERLREELRIAAIVHGYSSIGPWLTISIGAASMVPNSLQQPRELVKRADEALYASKATGRDRITPASTLS